MSDVVTDCRCFEYQTWCDCAAGRAWEAERRRLAGGPLSAYLAFLRGESITAPVLRSLFLMRPEQRRD